MTVMVFGASTDVLLRVVLLIFAVLLFNSQLALANKSDGQKKQFSGLINTETRPNWYGGSLNGGPGIDGSRGDGPDHSEGQPIIRRLLQFTSPKIFGYGSKPKTGQGSSPSSINEFHPHINPKGPKDPSTDPDPDGTSCEGPECKPKVDGPGETPKLPDQGTPVKPDPVHPVPSDDSDDPPNSPPPLPLIEPSPPPPPVKSTTYLDDQPPPPPITIPSPLPHSDESTSYQAGYIPPPTPISASAQSDGAGKLMRREDALVSTIPLILLGYFLA